MSNRARLLVALPNDGLFFFFFFSNKRHSLAFSNQPHEDSFVLSHEFSSSLCILIKKQEKNKHVSRSKTII